MQRIALISTNKSKFSETFIQKHRELLPFETHYLFGGYLPNYYGEGFPFLEGVDYPELEVERHQEMKWQLQEAIGDYLKEQQVNAVLAEYGMSGVEMMPVCEALKIPLIVHFHGYDAYRSDMLNDYGSRYPEMFRKAASVIAVSRHMEEALRALGCPASKIVYNPCGADERMFQPCNAGENPPVFLSVGRFDDTKCPHLIILAFREVYRAEPQARLMMIGDGHLKEACMALVKSLGLTDAVEFKGIMNHAEVARHMTQARALVQHSMTTSANDCEGTPVAVMEAGLSGLPVAGTRHGGIPDVVLHEQTGLLSDEGDISGMAENMLRMLRDGGLATSLGRKAHERVKSQFTLQKHLDLLAQTIHSAILQQTS